MPLSVVVCLHGLGRTARSMRGMRRALEDAGLATWSGTYPSRRQPLAALAAETAERIRADVGDAPLDAVTHSMGGVLARFLDAHLGWRRVVMLAPPNQGSAVARRLRPFALYRWYYGPAGVQLGDVADWPVAAGEVGVIAGTGGGEAAVPTTWLTRRLLPPEGPHDGTVSVAETRLPGLADFATVAESHTWIMNRANVQALTVRFLETGRFTLP